MKIPNYPKTTIELSTELEYKSIRGCVAIIIASDGSLCFQHRITKTNNIKMLSLIGGKRELLSSGRLETLIECLLREIWEETGILVSPNLITPLFAIQKHPTSTEQVAFFVIRLPNKPVLVSKVPSDSEFDPHWVDPNQTMLLPLYRYWTNIQALAAAGVEVEFPEP